VEHKDSKRENDRCTFQLLSVQEDTRRREPGRYEKLKGHICIKKIRLTYALGRRRHKNTRGGSEKIRSLVRGSNGDKRNTGG